MSPSVPCFQRPMALGWTALLLFSLAATSVHGLCKHDGLFFQNGSSWQPSACKTCSCTGWVTTCRLQECRAPGCAEGEVLAMAPGQCCPTCAQPRRACHLGRLTYQHGAVWASEGSPCEECQCLDGSVSCGGAQCRHSPPSCPPGQLLQKASGQCCATCITVGRSCEAADGTSQPHGAVWQPLACTKCRCHDGTLQCYLAQCPRLVCPANHTLELNPSTGGCCPECLGNPCLQHDRVYKSNEQWQPDTCTECACQAGRVECHKTACPPLACPTGQEPHTREGDCCPSCRPKDGWCSLPSGARRSPGSLWVGNACPEVCQCVRGTVVCGPAVCPALVCGHGQKLVERPEGRCCPDCQRDTGLCFAQGIVKQSGEVWLSGCQLCSCDAGLITCYTPECPACSPGYTPYYHPLNTSSLNPEDDVAACCPVCRRVSCSPHCLACEDSLDHLPAVSRGPLLAVMPAEPFFTSNGLVLSTPACTACVAGFRLQDYACVGTCDADRFERDGHCSRCHETCLACSEQTKFHCTSCAHPLVLYESQCQEACPDGSFALDGKCHPCHLTCHTCHGEGSHSCEQCAPHPATAQPRLLLGDSCVDSCPESYVVRAGKCTSCPSSCITCGLQEECLSCSPGLLLQEGRCVKSCDVGYYLNPQQSRCAKCHPYCTSCAGPGLTSCTSCADHLHLLGTSCLHFCPPKTFAEEGGCAPCSDACANCEGPGLNQCTSCPSPLLLQLDSGSSGTCVEKCLPLYQLHGASCLSLPGCADWSPDEPEVCKLCHSGWLQQDSDCVESCTKGYFQHQSYCIECDGRCADCSGPGPDHCTTCPPRSTLFQRPSPSTPGEGLNASCLNKCRKKYYLAQDLSCLPCHPSCSACSASTAASSRCLACPGLDLLTQEDRCVEFCSVGFFMHELFSFELTEDDLDNDLSSLKVEGINSTGLEQQSCVRCHPSCAECDGRGRNRCTKCPLEHHLTEQHTCTKHPCSEGFFQPPSSAVCQQCHKQCRTCNSGGANACTSCPADLLLLQGQCVNSCGLKHYANSSDCLECHYSCEGCLGPSERDCLECRDGNLREDNACVASCSSGYYPSTARDQCLHCPSGCRLCTSAGEGDAVPSCQACSPPFLLYRGTCVSECSMGSAPNVWEHTCTDCSPNCSVCSMFKCIGCEKSFYLQNGLCVKSCSENHHVIERNVSTCVSNVYQPILNILSPLVVEYGMPLVLNSTVIHIFDRDTSEEDLLIIVSEVPSNGYLYKVHDGRNTMIETGANFTAKDLREGRIIFKHERESSFYGEMRFQLNDGEFTTLPTIISINVMSAHQPRVVVNEPLIVRWGGEAVITKDVLHLVDQDSPEAVNILVRDGPTFGRLTIDDEDLALFSLLELSSNMVTYIHSNPEEPSSARLKQSEKDVDQVLLQATDGHNVVNFRLKILFVDGITPAPVMIKNRGLTIEKGKRKQITPDILQARDVDSKDETLIYSVFSVSDRRQGAGEFVIVIPLPPASAGFLNDGWVQMDEAHLLRPTNSFSQRDLNEGRVWYVAAPDDTAADASSRGYPYSEPQLGHQYGVVPNGRDPLSAQQALHQGLADVIVFSVSDSSNPPNVLKDQTFVVQIEEPSFVPPENKTSKANNQLEFQVLEGQALTFTSSQLSMAPSVASKHQVVYSITRPLGPDDGVLFHIDSPGLELLEFTQFDIDNRKIIYLPPFVHIGPEERLVSFKFTVSDGSEAEGAVRLPEHKLTIRVIPITVEEVSFANPDPEIFVAAHGTVELGTSVFELSSSSAEDLALFVLQQPPQHGQLTITPLSAPHHTALLFTKEMSLTMHDVRNSRISYRNSGSSAPEDSAVILALGQSSEGTSKITFKIELEDKVQPVVSPHASFSIKVEEGSSSMLSPAVLYFTDLHSSDDDLVYTLANAPQHGDLVLSELGRPSRTLSATHKFTQRDVLEGRLMFTASAEVGATERLDVVTFNVTDPSNNVLTDQMLNITVLPVDNLPPILIGSLVGELEVLEGGTVRLPPTLLGVTDPDTPTSRLKVTLVVPPVYGFITTDSNRTTPDSSFSQFPVSLLESGGLHYRQSQHRGLEPRRDAMIVFVTDGTRNTESFRVNITIVAADDEPPQLVTESVTLESGAVVQLGDTAVAATDEDTPQQGLSITVSTLPQHGTLYLKQRPSGSIKESVEVMPGQAFTLDDISSGRLVYEHDGSKARDDAIHMTVSDGRQQSTGELLLHIVDSDDKQETVEQARSAVPRLVRKQTLSVTEGRKKLLTGQQLQAVVDHLPQAEVEYVISREPVTGTLEMKIGTSADWRPLREGDDFRQRHLDDQMIRYAHSGRGGPAQDQLQLDLHVADATNLLLPADSLKAQVIRLQILADDTAPRPGNGSLLLTVQENGRAMISSDVVQWTDEGVGEPVITFKMARAPLKGLLALGAANPEGAGTVSAANWSQHDIDAGRLWYIQNSSIEAAEDTISFTVTDGFHETAPYELSVLIAAVDDQVPVVSVGLLEVPRGERRLVSKSALMATDADTADERVVFAVVRPPRHGMLQTRRTEEAPWTKATEFSMADVLEGWVSFLHDGSSVSQDLFEVTVSDTSSTSAVGSSTVAVPIRVSGDLKGAPSPPQEGSRASTTNETPATLSATVVSNSGLPYLEQRDDGKVVGVVRQTMLEVVSPTLPSASLSFFLSRAPQHGHLTLGGIGPPVTSFTQDNINKGSLHYQLLSHTPQHITNDSFTLVVSAKHSQLHPLLEVTMSVRWSWLVFAQTEYTVAHGSHPVNITVHRLGGAGLESSSVECSTHDGYQTISSTASFSVGLSHSWCSIDVDDNSISEGTKVLEVALSNAKQGLVGEPKVVILTVVSEEASKEATQAVLSFMSPLQEVLEENTKVDLKVIRSGSLSLAASALCTTKDGSGIGGTSATMMGYDFVRRPPFDTSVVVFLPGERESICQVLIIDDKKFELDEHFEVRLSEPSQGSVLGRESTMTVTIKGPNDAGVLKMRDTLIFIDPRVDEIDIKVLRSGPDINHSSDVWCELTHLATDYEEKETSRLFLPSGVKNGSCKFASHNFRSQGSSEYKVVLMNATNSTIDETSLTTKIITMSKQDSSVIQFGETVIVVNEPQGLVDIPLVRNGNLSFQASVNCFTRQRTALPGEDYEDRPKIKNSTITFSVGSAHALCRLNLIDDSRYEEDEQLLVKLAHPEGQGTQRVSLGKHKVVRVRIENPEDRPTIRFVKDDYSVTAPEKADTLARMFVELERRGDLLNSSRVRVMSQDGTAIAGTHYILLDDIVDFETQQKRSKFMVQVKHVKQWTEEQLVFNVAVSPVDEVSYVVGTTDPLTDEITATATVHLLKPQSGDTPILMLPAQPVVASMLIYDSLPERSSGKVDPGFPLICVSPCESRYPQYESTRILCEKIGLAGERQNKSALHFIWEVAVPDEEGQTSPFQPILDTTIFAQSDQKVLDSMFFAPNFLVKCVVTIVDGNGQAGTPLHSDVVKVAYEGKRLCPRKANNRGLTHNTPYLTKQDFSASLSYVNETAKLHPNTIHIELTIPHEDGMVPLVSTIPIHNIRYLLTEQLYRTHHACSNLHADAAFLGQRPSTDKGSGLPHQWDATLRQAHTVAVYRHLDQKLCQWHYSAWFTMTQLVDECGATVTSDFQVGAGEQSLLTVLVPLHVSRVFAAAAPPGWSSIDTRTELSVSLYYNTLLWKQGLTTAPSLTGRIQVSRVSLDAHDRLVIDFKTFSKFRGQFVLRHPRLPDTSSVVMPPAELTLSLRLELLWSAATFDGPEQVWRATSTTALSDYTGEYTVELIPCSVTPQQSYADTSTSSSPLRPTSYPLFSHPPSAAPTPVAGERPEPSEIEDLPSSVGVTSVCRPHDPTSFTLPLSIRPPVRPVPLAYTLDTHFQLFRDEDTFLQDPTNMDNPQASEFIGSYARGQRVFGRVLWQPSQELDSAYALTIQRLYICAGRDGHVPTYDPSGSLYGEGRQYGCLQPHPRLLHRALILDRDRPDLSVAKTTINPLGVRARLAEDVASYEALHVMPGVDGFVMETEALFAVTSGQQWFLQVLYTIGPSGSSRSRRDTVLYSALTSELPANDPSYDNKIEIDGYQDPTLTKNMSQKSTAELGLDLKLGPLLEDYDYSYIPGYGADKDSSEALPEPSLLQSPIVRNGTNIRGFLLTDVEDAHHSKTNIATNYSFIMYILLAVFFVIILVLVMLFIAWRYYKARRKTDDIVVVKSLKNEREECRRRDRESWGDRLSGLGSPVTLNSESNLQTVKVKTLAITVRNNLEEEGTEV